MPRIVKWKEKCECVRNLPPRPVKFMIGDQVFSTSDEEYKFFDETTPYKKIYTTLYDLIGKTIEEASANGYKPVDDFSQFVSVKEVPKWEI